MKTEEHHQNTPNIVHKLSNIPKTQPLLSTIKLSVKLVVFKGTS